MRALLTFPRMMSRYWTLRLSPMTNDNNDNNNKSPHIIFAYSRLPITDFKGSAHKKAAGTHSGR